MTVEFLADGQEVMRAADWSLGVPRRGDRVRLEGVKGSFRVADVTWKLGKRGVRSVIVDLRPEGGA